MSGHDAKTGAEDEPTIGADHTYASMTEKISSIVLSGSTGGRRWWLGLSFSVALLLLLLWSITVLFAKGVGIWGINVPVAWGFAIINFVWWIGIGHAGTLISAVLLLFRQKWRTSINRFAEAMTLFAVACAGLYPVLHLGRPWLFYWLFPYPNTMNVWPQFRSPLVWDVFAVSAYATVSLMFWFVGLIPDLATMRDRASGGFAKAVYGIFAMGWRGSAIHWKRYETAYLLLAGLATPLVVSVHSIVGLDFAVSVMPGWHVTVFPPYFVAGAVFSGFAMVMTLSIPLRAIFGMRDLITDRHLDNMAKVMLATGLIVTYGYLMEIFMGWYGASPVEMGMLENRMMGQYGWAFWALMACNVISTQLFWFKKVRRNVKLLFVLAIVVNIGMWLERYVIVVTSLHHDYLPSSWDSYTPTFWDWSTYIGTMGLFFTLLFLFVRFLPMISIFEMRELLPRRRQEHPPRMATPGVAPVAPSPPRVAPKAETEPELSGDAPWGMLAEFENADDLLDAARKTYEGGYRNLDAFAPLPVHGLAEALGFTKTRLPALVLVGALLGGVLGFTFQYWVNVHDYPMNIGGKPDNSWPAFIPVTFEMTILFGALTAVLGMLGLNRMPKPYHPVFHVEGFERHTSDRFFLLIRAKDGRFDRRETRRFMQALSPLRTMEVPR